MNTSTSLFAKALATENIFVSFDAAAPTASFDVESRTLIIPDWKISNTLRDMVVAHEVAHALYTPPEQLLNAMDSVRQRKLNPKGYQACLNVIEDARIERLIKEKFPGCRRDFYSGYREILDIDLFKLKSIDSSKLTIVDKINLHFKFGLFGLMQFDFTPQEKVVMQRVATAKTFEDVVAIANDLYEIAAEENRQRGGDGNFLGEEGNAVSVTDALKVEAQIDGNPEKGRHDMVYEDFPHLSYSLPVCNSAAAIVPHSVLAGEYRYMTELGLKSHPSLFARAIQEIHTSLDQFRNDSHNIVRELVAQFERRKAAEEYRNERLKPTGNLNPDRLHQYKTHDDIFLKNLIKHEGKKHGMVMLIDWSGSMHDCLDGTVRQTLLLTWFCRKAKIPYRVFFFTERDAIISPENGGNGNTNYNSYLDEKQMVALYGTLQPDGFDFSNFALREMFSSEQTDAEALEMERNLWKENGRYNLPMDCTHLVYEMTPPCMQMHGTPTCEAMLAMHDYIPKFREATGAQIVDFILVTDGEPTGLGRTGNRAYIPVKSLRVQHLATGRTLMIPGSPKYGEPISLQQNIQAFLTDEIRRLGTVTVGFSIGAMRHLDNHLYIKFCAERSDTNKCQDAEEYNKWYSKAMISFKAASDFYKKENFIPAHPSNTEGFDEYYIVRPVKPLASENDESIEDKSKPCTITRIRNNFIKAMNRKKNSRVFLARFIDLIAGRKIGKFKFPGA